MTSYPWDRRPLAVLLPSSGLPVGLLPTADPICHPIVSSPPFVGFLDISPARGKAYAPSMVLTCRHEATPCGGVLPESAHRVRRQRVTRLIPPPQRQILPATGDAQASMVHRSGTSSESSVSSVRRSAGTAGLWPAPYLGPRPHGLEARRMVDPGCLPGEPDHPFRLMSAIAPPTVHEAALPTPWDRRRPAGLPPTAHTNCHPIVSSPPASRIQHRLCLPTSGFAAKGGTLRSPASVQQLSTLHAQPMHVPPA